jgi:outer membrane lipoprotein LolB
MKFGGWRQAWALWLTLLVSTGCAVHPEKRTPVSGPPGEIKVLDLSGRISLRQGNRSDSGALRWHHAMPNHNITILAPLGQTVANIVQDADRVTLTTADKAQYTAADADHLMQKVLGWSLPLNGLQYWVLGRAVPGNGVQVRKGPDDRIQHMVQDDWQIAYSNYQQVGTAQFPGRIFMQRGDVEIRVVIDSWKVLPDER